MKNLLTIFIVGLLFIGSNAYSQDTQLKSNETKKEKKAEKKLIKKQKKRSHQKKEIFTFLLYL